MTALFANALKMYRFLLILYSVLHYRRVIAVDPSKLGIDLEKFLNVTHLKCKAEDIR